MGAAQSNNVAEVVSNVSNFVSNTTSANTDQVRQVSQTVNWIDCNVEADKINVNYASEFVAKNIQIANAKNSTDLQNAVQQKMLQEATSKVGSLGIGYASANNAANQTANVSNSILNAMNVTAEQFSSTRQEFNCIGGSIKTHDLNINFNSSEDFFSSQTLDNQSVNKAVNDITQSIDQKASATVEGLGDFLIALAILIGVIGYVLFKPLDSGPAKIAVGTGLCVALGALVVWAYMSSLPPFFSEEDRCIKNSNTGLGKYNCDFYKKDSIKLDSPPFRYSYPLTPDNNPTDKGNLLQFAISSTAIGNGKTPGDNGGYRMDTLITLANKIGDNKFVSLATKIGVPNIPNPLYNPADIWKTKDSKPYYAIPAYFSVSAGIGGDPTAGCLTPATMRIDGNASKDSCPVCPRMISGGNIQITPLPNPISVNPECEILSTTTDSRNGVANFNQDGWRDYLEGNGLTQEQKDKRSLFARFVLGEIIGAKYDQNVYLRDYEPVRIQNDNGDIQYTIASEVPDKVYKYKPVVLSSFSDGQIGGGTLEGEIGYCDSPKYHFNSWARKYGPILGIFLLIVAFFVIAKPRSLLSIGGTQSKQ